jgi:hypothetical protein
MNTTHQAVNLNGAVDWMEFLAGASLAALERWESAGDFAELRRFFETRKETHRWVHGLPLVQTLRGEVEIIGDRSEERRRLEMVLLRVAGRFLGVRPAG